MFKFRHVFWALIFVIAIFPKIVYAYIDPGSGTILLQVLWALFAAAVFAFKDKIYGLVKKIFKNKFLKSNKK